MGYSNGIRWTDELIEEKIWEVVNKLNIDHFPTHSEMIKALGNGGLSAKVSQKGAVYWAEKLGLILKYSETTFGNKFEIRAIGDVFENTGLHSVQTSSRHPYDLLVDNSVKIDVKVSKMFVNNCNARAFSFNLEKREPTCDIFLLYCLNDDETVSKILVIPACSLLGQTQIGVGKDSKWNIYNNRWDFVKDFCSFFEKFKKIEGRCEY